MKKDEKLEAKKAEIQQKLAECDDLKFDLQRTRADFENYRKNTEARVASSQKLGEKKAILSLLPVIDDIERAILHLPEDLKDNSWAQNVVKMNKNLENSLFLNFEDPRLAGFEMTDFQRLDFIIKEKKIKQLFYLYLS